MSKNNLNIPGSESNYLAECIRVYILSSWKCSLNLQYEQRHSLLEISCQLPNDVGEDVNTPSLPWALRLSLFSPSLIGPEAVINGVESKQ